MFHWICPECGREIPPAVKECPACDPNAAVAAAPPVRTPEVPAAAPAPVEPASAAAPVAAERLTPVGTSPPPAAPAMAAVPPPLPAAAPPPLPAVPAPPVAAAPPPIPALPVELEPVDPMLVLAEQIRAAQMEAAEAAKPKAAKPQPPIPALEPPEAPGLPALASAVGLTQAPAAEPATASAPAAPAAPEPVVAQPVAVQNAAETPADETPTVETPAAVERAPQQIALLAPPEQAPAESEKIVPQVASRSHEAQPPESQPVEPQPQQIEAPQALALIETPVLSEPPPLPPAAAGAEAAPPETAPAASPAAEAKAESVPEAPIAETPAAEAIAAPAAVPAPVEEMKTAPAETTAAELSAVEPKPATELAALPAPPAVEEVKAATTAEEIKPEPPPIETLPPPVVKPLTATPVEPAAEKPPSGSWLQLAPLQDYTSHAGRTMQPAAPRAQILSPDSGPRITLPGPALPPKLERLHEAAPVTVIGEEARPKKRRMPGWLVSLMLMLGIPAAGAGILLYFQPIGHSSADAKAPVQDAQAAPVAPVSSHPLAQYVEVTGFRIVVDFNKKSEIHYLVVNHSAADLSDMTIFVTLRAANAKQGQPPLCRFSFKAPSLGPFESKEMTSPIEKSTKSISLPDWQDLRAEVQIAQ